MLELFYFLKKRWKVCIGVAIAVIVLTFGIPLGINWMFKTQAPCDFLVASWNADAALSYYGSVLGFLGTVILSGLALWQNHVIQEANNRHTALLEHMERVKNEPHIAVKALSANGRTSNLRVKIINTSENIAEKLSLSGLVIVDELGNSIWTSGSRIATEYLTSGMEWQVSFENPQIGSRQHRIAFDIRYSDKFLTEYTCRVIGYFDGNNTLPVFKTTVL